MSTHPNSNAPSSDSNGTPTKTTSADTSSASHHATPPEPSSSPRPNSANDAVMPSVPCAAESKESPSNNSDSVGAKANLLTKEEISYSCNDCSDSDSNIATLIAVLQEGETLKTLNLTNNKLNLADGKLAEAIAGNCTLEKIVLNGNQIGHEGARALSDALKVNTTLQEIYLNENQIGNEEAKSLADALKENRSLQKVNLVGNQIGSEGASALSDAIKMNTTLQTIYLNRNQIGNEGARSFLDALKVNTTIQEICLARNQIVDEEMRTMADALKANRTSQKICLNSAINTAETALDLTDNLPITTSSSSTTPKSTSAAAGTSTIATKLSPTKLTAPSTSTSSLDTTMDSTQLDWHMEILCGLFLRSDEEEIDWLEHQVANNLSTSRGTHDIEMDLDENAISSIETPLTGTQSPNHHQLVQPRWNEDVSPSKSGEDAGQTKISPEGQSSQNQQHEQQVKEQSSVATPYSSDLLSMDSASVLVNKDNRTIDPLSNQGKDRACTQESPQQPTIPQSHIHSTNSQINKSNVHPEDSQHSTATATTPEMMQCRPKMEMELPTVEYSMDPTVLSLIPSALRGFLTFSPELSEEFAMISTAAAATLEGRPDHSSIEEGKESINSLSAVKVRQEEGKIKMNHDRASAGYGCEVNMLEDASETLGPSSGNSNGVAIFEHSDIENDDSTDRGLSQDNSIRHYYTRSAEKHSPEKVEDVSRDMGHLLEHPLSIPPSWRRSNYAALTLPQLEQHIMNSVVGRGGVMPILRSPNGCGQEGLYGSTHHVAGENSTTTTNGISIIQATNATAAPTTTVRTPNGNNPTKQQANLAHKKNPSYEVFTLLYNECSMTAFANWAMLDFGTNINESIRSTEGYKNNAPSNKNANGTHPSSSSRSSNRDNQSTHQGQLPQTHNTNWESYKRDYAKKLSPDTTRFYMPAPHSTFRLCGVCGKFGHYELECELLLNDSSKLRKHEREDYSEMRHTLMLGKEHRKKQKLCDNRENDLDEQLKKKLISFLAKEIRIQKTLHGLTVDSEQYRQNDLESHALVQVKSGSPSSIHGSLMADSKSNFEIATVGTSLPSSPITNGSLLSEKLPAHSHEQVDDEEEDDESEERYVNKSSCCKVCQSGLKGNEMLLCDGCDELFHFKCLDPPLNGVPEGDWFCSGCASYDSDVSSVVEIEGSEDFVIEQRKRSVAVDTKYYDGVSLGKEQSPWTAALSLLTEKDPKVKNEDYFQGHLYRQSDDNNASGIIIGELCWAKRFDDELGRDDWWPAMVTAFGSRRRNGSSVTVVFFALNHTAVVNLSDLLPFFPYYEEIGHKRLIRCDSAGHEFFRRAVELCASTLGMKSIAQILKQARNGIQKTLGLNENRSALSRKLISAGWRPPAGWEQADIDEADGIMILSKEADQGSSSKSTLNNASNNEDSHFKQGDNSTTQTGSTKKMVSSVPANGIALVQDSYSNQKKKTHFSLDEIVGGLVSWHPRSFCATAHTSGHPDDHYGVVVSINTATESALIRVLPILSEVSSRNFDAVFRVLNDDTSVPLIHAHDIGSTVWMPLSHLRFVSSKANKSELVEFRKTLETAMEHEMKSYKARQHRASVHREEHMVELESPQQRNIISEASAPESNRAVAPAGPIFRTDSGGDIYHVEAIIDERHNTLAEKEYLVKWKGFDDRHNTWEPARNIYSQDILNLFNAQKLLARLRETPESKDPGSIADRIVGAIQAGVDQFTKGIVIPRGNKIFICPWCKFDSAHKRAIANHLKKHHHMPNCELISECIKNCDTSWFKSFKH